MNSDFAALTRIEQLVSDLKPGEKFFDKEFGPKNDKDEIGNRMSLYSDGNAPPGYIIKILVETALDKWKQLMSVMSLSGSKN